MAGAAVKPPGPPTQPMQKNRASTRDANASAGQLAGWLRVLISLLIVWHLAAVALAPLSLPPSSVLVVDIAQGRPMQWYLDLLYLNHGYHFFAPDPGPGHIVRYEIFDDRGGSIKQGEFPNSDVHWPRLYYHRYFMLAEQVGIQSPDVEYRRTWQQRYLEAYARQLLRSSDGASIRLRWIAHDPLPPFLARQGRKLSDPEGYQTIMEVTQRRTEVPPPPPAQQSHAWQPGSVRAAGQWTGGLR